MVAVADLNLGGAEEGAGEIARGGGMAMAMRMDVGDAARVHPRSR